MWRMATRMDTTDLRIFIWIGTMIGDKIRLGNIISLILVMKHKNAFLF
jgi:hypothetical protein